MVLFPRNQPDLRERLHSQYAECLEAAAVSERTVDSHLRSILNKLGVNSRAQLAVWVRSAGR